MVERETAVSRWFKKALLLLLTNPGAPIRRLQPISRPNLLAIVHTHTQSRLLTHLEEEGQSSITNIAQNYDPGS